MEELIFRKQYFFPNSTSDKMTASDSHENEKHLLKFKNSKQKKRRHILHGHSSAHSEQVFAQRIKVCNNSNPLKNVYIKFTFLFLHFIFLYLLANKEPNTSENLPISCSKKGKRRKKNGKIIKPSDLKKIVKKIPGQ